MAWVHPNVVVVSRFSQLFRLIHCEEAPRTWLLDRHRDVLYRFLHIVASCGVITALLMILLVKYSERHSAIAVVTCAAAVPIFMRGARTSIANDAVFERWILAGLCTIVSISHLVYVANPDPIRRVRVQVLMTLIWMPIPALLGLRMTISCCYYAWSFLAHVLGCLVTTHVHGDTYHVGYFLVVFILFVAHLALARQQQIALRHLYDTEHQLMSEKQASESFLAQLQAEKQASASLLAMLCDACIWLCGDGDTVSRSHKGLDAALGSMQGCRLSDSIPEGERDRVMRAMREVHGGDAPVQLLSTSLYRHSRIDTVDAELFIVGSRRDTALSGDAAACGSTFLVGVRLNYEVGDGVEVDVQDSSASAKLVPLSGNVILSNSVSSSDGGSFRMLGMARSDVKKEPPSDYANEVEAQRAASANGMAQPPCLSPFRESEDYLKHCVSGLLHDIAGCLNFRVEGCCAWHSALACLLDLLQGLDQHYSCLQAWVPPAVWQCRTCSALIAQDMPSDSCWVCSTARSEDP